MCALDVAASARSRHDVASGYEIEVDDYFESRGADVDSGTADIREGITVLGQRGLASADIAASMAIVSQVARSDLATAFSAWAQRMVIDYLSLSPSDCAARAYLPALSTGATLGATALAAGTAHVLADTPLPVTFREQGDEIVLEGRIPWASNLIKPYVVVTAAAAASDPTRTLVVALSSEAPGLEVAPFPDLLALNGTGSTTVKLAGVRVARSHVISHDLHRFVHTVLARFLLLQGAFCGGLAQRSLAEAGANLGPMGAALRTQLEALASEVGEAESTSATMARDARADRAIEPRRLLTQRLGWSELAISATRLELSAVGGRGYLATSSTARRVREAAFLPIQAPTEVLLRWLLSRSA